MLGYKKELCISEAYSVTYDIPLLQWYWWWHWFVLENLLCMQGKVLLIFVCDTYEMGFITFCIKAAVKV